jgi:uncharacterized protein YceH (UPF0502 family)
MTSSTFCRLDDRQICRLFARRSASTRGRWVSAAVPSVSSAAHAAPAASGIAVAAQTPTVAGLEAEIQALLAQIADLQARLTAAVGNAQ